MPTRSDLITKIRNYKRQNCPSNIEKLKKEDLLALVNAIEARDAVITKLKQPRAPGAIATIAKGKANARAKARAEAGAPRRGRPKKAEAKQPEEKKREAKQPAPEEKKREVKQPQPERRRIIQEDEEDEEENMEFRKKKANIINMSNLVMSFNDAIKIKIKSFGGNERHIQAHAKVVNDLYNRIKGQIEAILNLKNVVDIDKELKRLKATYTLSDIIAKKEKWDRIFV